MQTGKLERNSVREDLEFPRVDPRYIGKPTRLLAAATSWAYEGRPGVGFHGLSVRDMESGKQQRYDFGASVVVEEHILVAKPGTRDEGDAWLVGTSFDAAAQRTRLSVFEARNVSAGPVALAELPYLLPLGFHGNFTAG